MTKTVNVPVGNQWTDIADSADGTTAVTIQNHSSQDLEIHIDDADDPTEESLGVFIPPREKELYAFTGKVRGRYPHLDDGKAKSIAAIKS